MGSKVFIRHGQAWAASLLLGLGLTAAAQAAPFCLTNEMIPPQCIYYDAQSCQQEAQRQRGRLPVQQRLSRLRPPVLPPQTRTSSCWTAPARWARSSASTRTTPNKIVGWRAR